MLIQFICQLSGMSMGGLADEWGIFPLVIMQIIALLVGGYFAFRLPKRDEVSSLPKVKEMFEEIAEGFAEVKKSKEIFPGCHCNGYCWYLLYGKQSCGPSIHNYRKVWSRICRICNSYIFVLGGNSFFKSCFNI